MVTAQQWLQFSAFLKVGLLQDMLCTFNAEKREFSSLITLGKNVCGHPTIVHGGLTAAIVDETLGGLNYVMKKRGMLDPGPAFTVHMTMDWKKVCHPNATLPSQCQFCAERPDLLAWPHHLTTCILFAANPCWVAHHMHCLAGFHRKAEDMGEGDSEGQARWC